MYVVCVCIHTHAYRYVCTCTYVQKVHTRTYTHAIDAHTRMHMYQGEKERVPVRYIIVNTWISCEFHTYITAQHCPKPFISFSMQRKMVIIHLHPPITALYLPTLVLTARSRCPFHLGRHMGWESEMTTCNKIVSDPKQLIYRGDSLTVQAGKVSARAWMDRKTVVFISCPFGFTTIVIANKGLEIASG